MKCRKPAVYRTKTVRTSTFELRGTFSGFVLEYLHITAPKPKTAFRADPCPFVCTYHHGVVGLRAKSCLPLAGETGDSSNYPRKGLFEALVGLCFNEIASFVHGCQNYLRQRREIEGLGSPTPGTTDHATSSSSRGRRCGAQGS